MPAHFAAPRAARKAYGSSGGAAAMAMAASVGATRIGAARANPGRSGTRMAETADERRARIQAEPLAPVGTHGGLFRGTVPSYRAIFGERYLLGLLVNRELKARYKDSSLGFLWSMIRPLTQLLIYYFALGEILGLARAIPSFALFVFIGLTAWSLFTEIVSGGTTSIVNNSGLVKKVYLPREIFPLSTVGGALFNYAIQLGILIVAMVVIGQFPWHSELVLFPLAFAVILVNATAFALLLSAVNVYLRDTQHLAEVALTVLFWASPIVYSFAFVQERLAGSVWEQLYLANPVTVGILGLQQALWVAGSESGTAAWPDDLAIRMWIALIVGLVMLWISQRVFSRLQGNFAQEL